MSEKAAKHLIVAVFGTQTGAEAARKALKTSRDEKLIGICASIAVHKDEKGQIHVKDTGMSAGKGAAEGSILGAAVGVLTGGATLALGAAGALAGGLVGRRKRAGCVEEQRLNQLSASLVPDSSALIVVMQPGWGVVVEQELQGIGADLFTADIPPSLDQDLDASHEAAYAALLSQMNPAANGTSGETSS
jgi:uncharacterized membrane protein